MATPGVVNRRDTRANQPAAAVGNAGVLFCVTDEGNIIERSNGTTWEAYSPNAPTGEVSSSAALTDHALVRGDGGAKGVQTSGILVSDDDEISGYKGSINTQTGTTYTLQSSDTGKIVECTNGSAIAVTADPALPKGFACTIVQGGAGQVTIASSGSGTVVNRQSHTKTAGQNAMCMVYVRSNSGSDAVFVLAGDTA